MPKLNTSNIKKTQKICLELLNEIKSLCDQHNLIYWLDGGTLLGAKRHKGFIPWDDDVDVCLPCHHYEILIKLIRKDISNKASRFLYFDNKKLNFWTNYYASTEYLVDGILPVHIDLIPVKFSKNSNKEKQIDQSLFQVAMLYVRGNVQDKKLILAEHEVFLPKKKNLLEQRERFLKFYMDYCNKKTVENFYKDNVRLNYVYNDAYVSRHRGDFSKDIVLPTVINSDFENTSLNQPNNRDEYLIFLYGENHMTLPEQNQRVPHQKFLKYNENFTKQQLQNFILELYLTRFISYDIGSFVTGKKKRFYKLRRFVLFTLKLFFKGEWRLAYSFWKYNFIHL